MPILLKPSTIASELLKTYAVATQGKVTSKTDLGRIHNLRPSQLPFCAGAYFYKHAMRGIYQDMDYMGGFYTRVGSAVHEVVQTYMGPSGKLLADWHCRVCGKKRELTHKNKCCGITMDYHEVSIDYAGIVGHIDAIFRDSKGDYWILDFKTTSLKGAPSKQKRPGASYIEQIEAYAFLLWKQYGIKCKGVALMFIPRDNPKEPVVFTKTLKNEDYKEIGKRLKKNKADHTRVAAITKKSEALALAKEPKCSNPFCSFCRSSFRRNLLVQAYNRGKEMGHLPIKNLKYPEPSKKAKRK